jgi:nicotinate-nucleotide adenylyltransferase
MTDVKVGIMGGTFDPIHFGHLVIAETAYHQLLLDKVVFVPAHIPPHKQDRLFSSVTDRVEMTRRAIAGNYHFDISLMEIEREGVSYSVDTVSSFAQMLGSDAQLWFICGADSIIDISTWYQPERLLQSCRFAAAARPGFDISKIADLPRQWQEKIDIIDIPLLDICSTDLRQRVQSKQSIKYLLPEKVEEYIYEQKLYCPDKRD